jgi:hypothetical protein
LKYPSLFLSITLTLGFLVASSCGQDNSAQNNQNNLELAAMANAKLSPTVVNQTATSVATAVVVQSFTDISTQPAPLPPVIYTVTATAAGTGTATTQSANMRQ